MGEGDGLCLARKPLPPHALALLSIVELTPPRTHTHHHHQAPLLRAACINYILGPEKNDVIDHPTFKQELEAYPLMLFPIIKAAPSLVS